MLNRNAQKSTAAIEALSQEFGADAEASFVQMDLAALDSVRAAAADVLEKVRHIDALVCNAAIAQVPTQEITVDGFESQLGVNHFGHFLLCGLLYERIEASRGRIVVVGSNGYKMGLKRIQFDDLNFDGDYSGWNGYAQSKRAPRTSCRSRHLVSQRSVSSAGIAAARATAFPTAGRAIAVGLPSGLAAVLGAIVVAVQLRLSFSMPTWFSTSPSSLWLWVNPS